MSNDEDGDGELYEAVAQTSQKNLRSAVEKVDGLSLEDEEALERGGRFALRGTLRRIARWSLWVLFTLGAATAAAALFGFGYLTYSHLMDAILRGQTEPVLSSILTFLGGVFTTLGVEFLWHLSTRNKN